MNTNNSSSTNQRHGCLTAWLVLMIIANSATTILYFFTSVMVAENPLEAISSILLITLSALGAINVICSILLFQWKKIGFWSLVVTSIIALIINLSIDTSVTQSLLGFMGLVILYGLLQIKKNGVSAWENLE